MVFGVSLIPAASFLHCAFRHNTLKNFSINIQLYERKGRRTINPPGSHTPNLVYFSSVSENTRRFVEKLGFDAVRIPLRLKKEGMLYVNQPYVLIVPTYGGGNIKKAIPMQVRSFLNVPENRALLRGVVTSGNTNFGEAYCSAGPLIAQKCGVPELYHFELLGTPWDVTVVRDGLEKFFHSNLFNR